jgi:hypothetical protein
LSTASWPVREAHRPQIHSQQAPKALAACYRLMEGAMTKDEIAEIRTRIQTQGSGPVAAA